MQRRTSCHRRSLIHDNPIKYLALQYPKAQSDSSLFATDDDNGNDDNTLFEEMDVTQEFDAEALEEMEREQPSEWMVMKELLGINIFTFILAGLIVFFLSMNMILGPGWLGNTLGIQGTGSFEEVSPSLPGSLDLNKPEFKL